MGKGLKYKLLNSKQINHQNQEQYGLLLYVMPFEFSNKLTLQNKSYIANYWI